jgi:hypothetical protein
MLHGRAVVVTVLRHPASKLHSEVVEAIEVA